MHESSRIDSLVITKSSEHIDLTQTVLDWRDRCSMFEQDGAERQRLATIN